MRSSPRAPWKFPASEERGRSRPPAAQFSVYAGVTRKRSQMTDDRALAAVVRLDVWLDVACLFRTRSEAQKACKGGKVDVNGQRAKSNRVVRVGDILELKRPYGRTQRLVVRAISQRHVTKAEARLLYEDLTP